MAFLSVNQLCQHLHGKKVRLNPRQTMSLISDYAYTMLFSWAAVDVGQHEVKVSLMTKWELCREVMAQKIKIAHLYKNPDSQVLSDFNFVPIESNGRYVNRYNAFVSEYISSLCYPGIIVAHGIRKKQVSKILEFLHYYEKFARAGKTQIYEIDQASVDRLYQGGANLYGGGETLSIKSHLGKNAHLIVFPSFWKTSPAYISTFLLIIRALSRSFDNIEAGNAKSFPPKPSGDIGNLKSLMYYCDVTEHYVGVDTIRMFCRRWRTINGKMKRYQWPPGYSNAGVATSLANTNYYSPNVDPNMRASLNDTMGDRTIYKAYLKKIYELLQQEKRRMSPRKKLKAVQAKQLHDIVCRYRALPDRFNVTLQRRRVEINQLINSIQEDINEVV